VPVPCSRLRDRRSDRASSGCPAAHPKVRRGRPCVLDRHPDRDPRCLVTVLSRVSRGEGPPNTRPKPSPATRADGFPPTEVDRSPPARPKKQPKPRPRESVAVPSPAEAEDRPAVESRPATPPTEVDHRRETARDPRRSEDRLSLTSVCRPRRPKPTKHPTAESRPTGHPAALPPAESVGPSGCTRPRVAAGCFAASTSTFALSSAVLVAFLEAASRFPEKSERSPHELHVSLGVRTVRPAHSRPRPGKCR